MNKYDRALSIFSPDGRIFQVEYAQLASERGSPVIFYSDEKTISVAIEKRAESKHRILSDLDKFKEVETNIYVSFAGIHPDSAVILDRIIYIAREYCISNNEKIDIKKLALETSDYIQRYTITGGCRPFGVKLVLFGFDNTKPIIALIEPDGNYSFYKGGAIGQKSEKATEELEKHGSTLSPTQAVIKTLFTVAQKDPNKMSVYEISPKSANILPPNSIAQILDSTQG